MRGRCILVGTSNPPHQQIYDSSAVFGFEVSMRACGFNGRKSNRQHQEPPSLRADHDIIAADGGLLDGRPTLVGAAAPAIFGARAGPREVRPKADFSPFPACDHAAEAVILEGLARLLPGVCVVSEEAVGRALPDRIPGNFVLVDP